MSYQRDRDQFIARMSKEGLPIDIIRLLLRAATTLNRIAELECSSESADKDRVPCPGIKRVDDCICDIQGSTGTHVEVPRIQVQAYRLEKRVRAMMPAGWSVLTTGDPRGNVLSVIPPSYVERNRGRDRFNLDAIGVPAADSRIRW